MKVFILSALLLAGCGSSFVHQSGNNGTNGSSCSVASVTSPQAGSLITCTNGTSSLVLNGTIVAPVQFCQGFTQSYPSTFAESGVCIGGVMYGVYSANGGFLAELPSGTYSSNGINSSCTFTLNGCAVSSN